VISTLIKSLEIQGFKSFNKRISLPLSNGFTAIVGPNGSGKSNICDAICFVLGRTSARSMRAERLTHLIYNGGKGHSAANFLEVSLILDNKNRSLPFDEDEVVITRRLTRKGTMSYKLNSQRVTRAQMVDMLASNMFQSTGHNIVLQGDITSFIEMDPIQRRGVLDELCGIAEYDEKKEKAKKDLGEVELRIKEIVIVLSERKKRLQEVRKEKEDAEKYQRLKEEANEIEGRLAFSKFKQVEKEDLKYSKKIGDEDSKEKELSREITEICDTLKKKEARLKEVDKVLVKDGGTTQVGIKHEVERTKGQISINESKIESKQAEISRIDSLISKLQEVSLGRPVKHFSALESKFPGVIGLVRELFKVDTKYKMAVESAMGKRINNIVVDTETTAIKCVEYLRENQLGRATFLPLNKIRGKRAEDVKGSGIIGLATKLIEFDSKYSPVFSYVLGDTYIVDDLNNVKPQIGKLRMASLVGDIAERSGAITGGFVKKRKKDTEITDSTRSRDKLLDEIEDLRLSIEGLKKDLEETLKKDKQMGTKMESLQRDREILDIEIDKLRTKKENLSMERNTIERGISDLRVEKARVEAKMTDIKINMAKFKDKKFEEGDIEKMAERLTAVNQQVIQIEPVNMKAIELYDGMKQDYEVFEEKFNKLQEERKAVLDFMDDIEEKKKNVFFSVYNKVSEEFSKIFPKLSPEGEAKFILEDAEDPLAGGLFIEAKPAGKKLLSLDAMSGGEKVITALAFLFSLQRYKPAPFYVLDEVDAALDQTNSMRFVDLLGETVKKAQLLIISHNNSVVKRADRAFGVSMHSDGTSKVVGIELKEKGG